MNWRRIIGKLRPGGYNSARAYGDHLRLMLSRHPDDRDLAFALAIGSISVEMFEQQGDIQAQVLRHHGLADGMTVYDLGCGCGRTAQALRRSGWRGRYVGADIVPAFVAEMRRKCPGYEGHVHRAPTIVADDASVDMVFHWSVFTHIAPEECYLYMEDTFRALRPGGKLVFSFLELSDPEHQRQFHGRVDQYRKKHDLMLLDTFLHRDWIRTWAAGTGFSEPAFTDGQDRSHHTEFWQAIAVMQKPA